MTWNVTFTTKANKQHLKLSKQLQYAVLLLVEDLKNKGGNPGKNWPNYRRFKGLKGQKKTDDLRHCHLQKGNPVYVCCWMVNAIEKTIKVYYVGTHEKAPY